MRGPNEFILFRDGNAWCAAPPHFHDLQEDPTGWGDTRERAVSALINNPEFKQKAVEQGWPERPAVVDFLEVSGIKYEPDADYERMAQSLDRDRGSRAAHQNRANKVGLTEWASVFQLPHLLKVRDARRRHGRRAESIPLRFSTPFHFSVEPDLRTLRIC